MRRLQVCDADRMCDILGLFSVLDDIRWNTAYNYNLINYSHPDLTADQKLLTHWLCYVMDRQMPFERVWDIGGYVTSHLVRTYTATNQDIWAMMQYYIGREDSRIFLKAPNDAHNERLDRHGISGKLVRFASRYIPEDLTLIYRTLGILHRSWDRSLARFIAEAIKDCTTHEQSIKRMARALNQLTYSAGRRVSIRSFDTAIREVRQEVSDFVPDFNHPESLWNRKRLWCSLRDYLKSPEFNPVFIDALSKAKYPKSREWNRSNKPMVRALRVLELPGDVWNNAPVFREGLFAPFIEGVPRTWDMPRTIRAISDQLSSRGKALSFYPEQLDVTFDFVPRMCARSMCRVCPFGAGIDSVCHRSRGKLCPMPLYSCGYEHICDPDKCAFKDNRVRGICAKSVATR